MATGSYEGSLSTEGIPDHHEASLFTGRRPRWSRRLIASSDPYVSTHLDREERANGEDAAPAKASEAEAERRVATGVSEARSQRHRGKKTPTLVSGGREANARESVTVDSIRRSDHGRRETSRSPEVPRGAQDSVGTPRRESGESEPGTHAVRVHADRLGGRRRLNASRVFFTGRSKGLLVRTRGR
jgi:hypothetical protein